MRILKKIGIRLAICIIVIQFIKIANKSGEPLPSWYFQNPDKGICWRGNSLKNTCYDCHSNVAAIPGMPSGCSLGWLSAKHAPEAERASLNFLVNLATNSTREANKQAYWNCRNLIKGRRYAFIIILQMWMHKNAGKLSDEEKKHDH